MKDFYCQELSSTDRGFLLGDGLFETIKIQDYQPLHLSEHLNRLTLGAERLGIPCSFSQVERHLNEELSRQNFASGVARLTLTRGSGERGLTPPLDPSPRLFIHLSPLNPCSDQPLRLWVSSIRRNEFSPGAQLKTLSYTDNILARMEAHHYGADEALMLNTQGFVACAAAGNIFIEKNGVLITPPLSAGVLPGIMRAKILKNERAREQQLTLQDCLSADAIFVTNVLSGKRMAIFQCPDLILA